MAKKKRPSRPRPKARSSSEHIQRMRDRLARLARQYGFVSDIMSELKVIVGLGNPGKKYQDTRHNTGFWVIERLSEKLGIRPGRFLGGTKRKFAGSLDRSEYEGQKLILFKPQKFMNCSGEPVAAMMGFYKLPLTALLVVTDDMALEPGRIRLRRSGSSGGHNGLADIIEKLGSDNFARLRVGIGRPDTGDDVDYVLSRPSAGEKRLLDEAAERAADAALCWANAGIEQAMNTYNS